MDWTDERIAALKKFWLEGMSASQVARQLGGVSRNAVIGKVHRMGLSGREAPSRPRNFGGRPVTRPKVRASAGGQVRVGPQRLGVMPPMSAPVFDVAPSATILTLGAHACRWPIGDPGEEGFGFCGRRRMGSGPYCEGHSPMAARKTNAGAVSAQIEFLARRFGA
jgi:GcrA cell cycle regulator